MSKRTALIFVALALGLGWAIRGHFGHEWGASWAGVMAALAVLVAAKREDWSLRMPVLVFLGGIGWAVGGMMSYGLIVGYCRGNDFGNVYYGFSMLGVVGGLYGFIGGGMLGIGLESTDENKPNWPSLLTEMIAGAVLFWGVLIPEFEWKMTPPRSELWAACVGASIALAWYLHRNGYHRALRLAGYSALGAGFGFAFGNFLQILGNVIQLPFNWWNVMEFTLGFCGGLGVAYGVFTREWPVSIKPSKTANWLALVFLLFAIPATNLIHTFEFGEFKQMAERIGIADPTSFAYTQILLGWIVLFLFLVLGVLTWRRFQSNIQFLKTAYVPIFLFAYSIFYLIFSHLKKGFFFSAVGFQLEQYLYWVVLAIIFSIWFFMGKKEPVSLFIAKSTETWQRWITILSFIFLLIAIMTVISINIHNGLSGGHERF